MLEDIYQKPIIGLMCTGIKGITHDIPLPLLSLPYLVYNTTYTRMLVVDFCSLFYTISPIKLIRKLKLKYHNHRLHIGFFTTLQQTEWIRGHISTSVEHLSPQGLWTQSHPGHTVDPWPKSNIWRELCYKKCSHKLAWFMHGPRLCSSWLISPIVQNRWYPWSEVSALNPKDAQSQINTSPKKIKIRSTAVDAVPEWNSLTNQHKGIILSSNWHQLPIT